MVAEGRVEQGPQRDNYLAWGLFQVRRILKICVPDSVRSKADTGTSIP
jgi:hypothetical protein